MLKKIGAQKARVGKVPPQVATINFTVRAIFNPIKLSKRIKTFINEVKGKD